MKQVVTAILLNIAFSAMVGCSSGKALGPENETELASAAQTECGYVQNDYGERVSWKSNLPVKIYIDSSVPAEFQEETINAAKIWEQASNKKLFEIEKSKNTQSLKPSNDNINSIYWSNNWNNDKKNQQAVTALTFKGPLITEADIKINAEDYVYYAKSPQNSKQIHFESLILHELGHVLGFKHLTTKPTIMWASLAPSFIRTEVYSLDLKTLKCEY